MRDHFNDERTREKSEKKARLASSGKMTATQLTNPRHKWVGVLECRILFCRNLELFFDNKVQPSKQSTA